MKNIILVFFIFILGCTANDCEFEFFESVTGITSLKNHQLVDCPVETDFSKSVVLKIHADSISKFLQTNEFISISEIDSLQKEMLMERSIEFPEIDRCYILEGQINKNSWTYILDPKTGILWGELLFPDWSGD